MPRKKGAMNYKNDVLIDIIEEILPNGELVWEAVAIAYQAKTNEESLRDMTDVKKHWLVTFPGSASVATRNLNP
jgi:hypothetical protein